MPDLQDLLTDFIQKNNDFETARDALRTVEAEQVLAMNKLRTELLKNGELRVIHDGKVYEINGLRLDIKQAADS